MAAEETKVNPFYKHNKFGVNLRTSDPTVPQDAYDRDKASILGGLSIPLTAQFYVQRDAANFILNKAFAMFAKNLSIQGVTGTNFVKKLHENAEAEAKRRGKKYLVKEDLETAVSSMIVYELGEVDHAPTLMARLLIVPQDVNVYGTTSGSISVTEDIKTHMTDYDISRSGVRKAGRDLECTTDGLLAAETLKDTGSTISPDQTAQWEVARQRAEYIAGRGLKLLGGDVDFTGVGVEGEKVQVKAKRKVTDRPLTISEFTKDATSVSQKTRSVGSNYKSSTTAEITAEEEDISLMATHIEAPKTILRAINGKVALLAGVNTSSSSKVEKKANKFRQKITQSSEAHQTYTPCMFTGDVEIESAETNIEVVRGQPLDWMNRIRQHGGSVVYNMLDELHKVESHSVQGPSAALCAVIALAVTIATQGTGAGLLGTTGVISSAMANAAFSTLCSQAAVALATNNGDIGRAAESLANTDTLKSLGVEVALAGLTGVGAKPDTFIGYFAQAAHKASYRMLVEKVVYGKTDEKGVALNALSSAVGTFISTEIGTAHYNGEIQGLAHKALHGISGGIQGLILRGEKGITPGALGAVVAETVADVMTPTGGLGKVSASQRPNYSADQIRLTQNVARLTAGVAALLAGMDEASIGIAISTATTAVENNFAKSAEKAGQETVEEEAEGEAAIDSERELDEILWKSSGGEFAAAGSETLERERPLSPTSRRMMDSIEILDDAIKEEQRGRYKKDVGFFDDYLSRTREMALRQELATAQQLYQGHQSQKAMGRIASGSRTTDDLLEAGTPLAFAAVSAVTGAKGMGGRGIPRGIGARVKVDGKLFQEHHIISDKAKATRDHPLLSLAGLNLQSKENKMLLPTRAGAMTSTTKRSIHEGRHLGSVNDSLAALMDKQVEKGMQLGWNQSQYREALLKIINQERKALKLGERMLRTGLHSFSNRLRRMMV
jgi:hypothetical protein